MAKKLRTMDDAPLDGKRVLVRVDFNVSVGDDNKVDEFEDYRIESALPTIEELMQKRCRVILLTHRGRHGDAQDKMNLDSIHARLEDLLKEPVRKIDKLYGDSVNTIVDGMMPGEVALLPNVREDDREESASGKFAKNVTAVADAMVSEAFSVTHRAHSSVSLMPRQLPSVAGRRLALEVNELTHLKENPDGPYLAIVSGSKIKTKIGLLYTLLKQVDHLCVGGQIANVFLAAKQQMDPSHYHPEDIAAAQHILDNKNASKLSLLDDVVVGDEDGSNRKVLSATQIPSDVKDVWDIGPKTVSKWLALAGKSKTVMWNGPVGKFEIPAYSEGTTRLALGIADLPAYRVVGGGDTVIALEQNKLINKYDHVSVGGGAMVAFLEGELMPGLDVLYG